MGAGVSIRGQRLLLGGGRVQLADHEWADPGPNQLLVRVTRSQVSAGSEINAFRTGSALDPTPRPTGYTTAGRVERVGPGVEGFQPGDRVLAYGNHASHCLVDMSDPNEWRSYPQVIPDGYYFVMGDHRNNSSDSRHWGMVPKKYIIGKVQLRWWPVPTARMF